MTIRAGTARSVVQYLQLGYAVKEAVSEAAKDLAGLKTGFLDEVIIHAIASGGEHFVMGVNLSRPVKYLLWSDSLPSPEIREGGIFAAD
jgi:hypothetical protein